MERILMPLMRLIALLVFAASTLAAQAQPAKIQTEIIELGRFGLTPKKIVRRAAGKHYLLVRVVIPVRPLALTLGRVQGGRLREVTLNKGQPHWKELLELTPGTYLLKEASHPEWVCQITIGN